MNYEIFVMIDNFTGKKQDYILLYIDEDNRKTFPADESNADFVQFVEDNPDWNKK